jgi:hypothetical protein
VLGQPVYKRDVSIPQATQGSGAQITVAAGGQQVSPLVEVSPYLPGYSVNRSATPVRGPFGTINPGQMVGPNGQLVDTDTAQALLQQAATRQRQSIQSPDQQDLTKAQTAQTKQAILDAQAQITQKHQVLQISQGNLDFLKSKQAFESSISANADARATQQQVFSQQQAVSGLQLQVQQMVSAHNDLQAQLQQQTQQFNATTALATQKANADFQVQQQQQLQSLGTAISNAAMNPGDRAKEASLLLANSGWGQQDQALAGADLRTQTSVMPLQALLNQRTSVMGENSSPYSFTPTQTPQLAPLDLSSIQMPTPNTAGSIPSVAPQTTAGMGSSAAPLNLTGMSTGTALTNPNAAAQGAAASGSSGPNGGAGGVLGVVNGQAVWAPTGSNSTGVTAAATGGLVQSGAYLGDERGAEVHIPLGAGLAYVIKASDVTPEMKAMIGQKKAAGGIFDSTGLYSGTGIDPNSIDTTGAFNFLNQSAANASAGTPWAGMAVPTPVYASSPGFAPENTAMLAGLAAQSQGIDPATYTRIANMLAPVGVNGQGPTRRTG